MAGQVQIVISVDDKGAISALQQVGAQAKQLGPSFQKSGAQGNVVFTEMTKNTRQAHDAAALFNRVLGVELPRQLDNFLARSKTIGPVLSQAFNVAVIAGFAIAIIGALDRLTGFSEELGKIKQQNQEIFDAAAQANKTLLGPQNLQQVNQQIIGTSRYVEQLNKELDLTGGMMDALRRGGIEHPTASVILGFGLPPQVLREKLEILDQQKARLNDLTKLQAELRDQETRTEPIEILKLKNQALLAGAEGYRQIALTAHGAIAVIDRSEAANVVTSQVAAAQRQQITADEYSKRKALALQYLTALRSIENQMALIGAGPFAQIALRGQAEIQAIEDRIKQGGLGKDDISALRAQQNAIEVRAARETVEQERQIHVAGNQAILQAQAQSATGRTQIENEYLVQIAQIAQEEIQLSRGKEGVLIELTERRIAAQIVFDRRLLELRRTAALDTAKLEEQAATAMLPPWQRTYAQIAMTAQENQRQIDQAFQRTEISSDDAARRTAANWQIAWAQTRDTLASTIEGFFDDITSGNIGRKFLQMFKHQVAEMVASWILGLQGMRQSAAGAFSGGGGGAGGGGGILGAIFGSLFGGNRGGANTGAATPPFFPVGGGSAASALPLSMLTPGAFSQGGGNGISGIGLGSGFDLFGMGSPIGPGGTAPFNGPLSSGVGARIGSTLPSGSTIGSPLLSMPNSIKIGGLTIPGGLLATLGLGLGLSGIMAGARGNPIAGLLQGGLGGLLLGGITGGLLGGGLGLGIGGIRSGNIAAGTIGMAATGFAIGTIFGGPIIGAIVGGLIGLFGAIFGGAARRRKREALEQEVIAQAKKIEDAYKVFQLDYNSANTNLEQLRADEIAKLAQIGSKDKSTQDARVNRHIDQTEKEIQAFEAERARRTQLISTLPLPEFAAGGFTGSAGPMLALLHPREAVLNPIGRSTLGDSAIESLNRGQAPMSSTNVTINFQPGAFVASPGMDERKFADQVIRRMQSKMADQGISLGRA